MTNTIQPTISPTLEFYSVTRTNLDIPLIGTVNAGFPSPADDFLDQSIDLNKAFIRNPSTTFCARVKGNSMQDAGLSDGDLLIIDKSLEPSNGNIAVCFIDGEFTVKRIQIEKDCCYLVPANDSFKALKVTPDNEFIIWGIVTTVIKAV